MVQVEPPRSELPIDSMVTSRASILRYRDGATSTETLGSTSGSVGAMVKGLDGRQYVTTTMAGGAELYRADRGTWERVLTIDLPSANGILAMAPREDGFIFGGGSGHFGEVVRGVGLCEATGVPPPEGVGIFWGVSRISRVARDRYLILVHGLETLSPHSRIIGSGLVWLDVR